MKRFVLFALALSFCLPVVAQAAWLDPTLAEQIDAADADTVLSSYVILRDRIDLRALTVALEAEGADFARRHYEIITMFQEHAEITQAPLRDFLDEQLRDGLVASYRPFWIDNALRVVARPEFFALLQEHPDVDRIYYDYEIELVEPVRVSHEDAGPRGVEIGIEIARAPELWGLGIDGTGVIVADIDTGCDGSHPAFATRWRGLEVAPSAAWYDPAQGTDFPYDSGSHGTHTMGTMIGDDGGDNQIGMAPGAKWIAAAVVDVPGVSIYTEAVAAFEWCADPDGNPGTTDDIPAVANNSWGIRGFPHCDDHFWAAMDTAEAAGVAVVFAAGNEGPFARTLRSPADRITTLYNAFSIGALKPNGEHITSFSSRGPSRCDWATIKPEVCAVGEDVRSSTPDENYSTMDGTSMASPHVSGAIALLRQAYPDATVDELKMALYWSAVDLGAVGEDNTYGMGRIDVVAAHAFLLDLCDKDDDGYDDPSCGGSDCNDLNADVYPGAEEICDGLDNNCDDTIPNDEIDHDGDNFYECEGDCEPNDETIHPNRTEICDGIDNNCDEELLPGEDDPDEDGVMGCEGDCEPDNGDVYPGAEEVCDGVDNNCDDQYFTGEMDLDEDGYLECLDDCDDENGAVNPGATESCFDGIDNDCDGLIDDEDPDCEPVIDDDTTPVDDDTLAPDDDITDDDTTPAADDDDDDDNDDDDACGS